MDLLIGLATFIASWLLGGGMERMLNWITPFKDWHPADPLQKQLLVAVICLIPGGLLTFLALWIIPTYYPNLPIGVAAFLYSFAIFANSQLTHASDKARQLSLTPTITPGVLDTNSVRFRS